MNMPTREFVKAHEAATVETALGADQIEIVGTKQGDMAWLMSRLGLPTAAKFNRIVTPTGKISSQARRYAGELLAEFILAKPKDDPEDFQGTFWTERGLELEPQAAAAYAVLTGIETWSAGVIRRKGEWGAAACSPDKIAGDGLVELKCPMPHTHLLYLAQGDVPREYLIQVQAQLWVSQRPWVDFVSFHPEITPFHVRAFPDERIQRAFDTAIPEFCTEYAELGAMLANQGVTPVDASAWAPEIDE